METKFQSILITLTLLFSSQQASALLGGKADEAHQFASTVRLWPDVFGNGCTGVKIADKFFLTAAHCFNDYDQDTDFLSLIKGAPYSGDEVLLSATIFQYNKQYAVRAKSVHLHPSWRTSVQKRDSGDEIATKAFSGEVSDLAVYEVADETPIPIAQLSFELMVAEDYQSVLIGGYGRDEGGRAPSDPSYGEVSTFAAKNKFFAVLPQTLEKVETDDPRVVLRDGDSGGPVYKMSKEGQLQVVGINSGGANVGAKNEIGTAARIDLAKEWICSLVQLKECR